VDSQRTTRVYKYFIKKGDLKNFMKNKKLGIGILATLSLATAAGLLFGLSGNAFSLAKGTVHDANCEWNHYEEVEPTYVKHGSKEFWACCTHPGEFELTEPASGNITDSQLSCLAPLNFEFTGTKMQYSERNFE
jgi:hypothetical protein